MCTLTWHDGSDGYQVFFNRDERRARKPELPAEVRRVGDARFIAPLDGDFGGTWIAVNEHGLSVCLLNGFSARDPAVDANRRDYTTRGSLTMRAIPFASATDVEADVRSLDLDKFRPFVLVAFEPHGAGLVASWSGVELETSRGRPVEQPFVSSSFFTAAVRASRRRLFDDLGRGPDKLAGAELHLAFHASHSPERGPHSPCMHRPDASTVSFCRIEVDADRVRMHYAPRSPCRGLPAGTALSLERSRAQ